MLPISGYSMFGKRKYKMGLQLYTIHQYMAKDTVGTLKAVKALGYEDFEAYGFDADKETFYGLKSSEFKNLLEDLELTVSSGHYGFSPFLAKSDDDLKHYVDQCIKAAHALDMKYITLPRVDPEPKLPEDFKLISQQLNSIGEQITDAGLGFAYHNNGFEFVDFNRENGYDIILKETDPSLVKLQMDMYWVMHASKLSPRELVKRHPGRYVMWHIKDMDKITRDYTELGNGSIDYAEILPDPAEAGLEFYYLEQGGNFTHNPMRSVADSADYFKKNLKSYL